MERLGGLGVHTLEELQTFSSRVSTAQRRKRHLAEGLPHAPGVYLFRDDAGRVLYVGTSRDLRTRVRTYFTASETRSRMGEMVGLATSVTGIDVQHGAGGRGPRAAADRPAQAALQPALPVPGEGALRQAHPRALAAALAGQEGARRRRRLPRPVRVAQGRREVPGGAARDVPGPAVLRPARAAPVPGRLRARRDGPLPLALRRQRRRDDVRRGRPACCATPCCGGPTRWSRRSTPGWPASPRTSASRRPGVHRDRLAAFVRAAARAPSGSPR